MINFKSKIPFVEYSSSDLLSVKSNIDNKIRDDIRNKNAIRSGTMDISLFKLSMGIAKSLFSKVPTREIIIKMAHSYFIQLQLMLMTEQGHLYINNNNIDLFRDFSKSCRDGEIAQGISYLFAQDFLNAFNVQDFKYYCYNHKNFSPKCKHKTPDYVLVHTDGSISLLEAKGLMEANPTQSMTYACDQCKHGEDYLNKNGIAPNKKYVSAISFSKSTNKKNRYTKIFFADPPSEEGKFNTNPESVSGNMIFEYAKFFYIAGNDLLYKKIHNDSYSPTNNLNEYSNYFMGLCEGTYERDGVYAYKDNGTELIAICRKKYYSFSTDDEYEIEFGITKEAAEHLSQDLTKVYRTNKNKTENRSADESCTNNKSADNKEEDFNSSANDEREREIFSDGTYMSIARIRKFV